MLPGEVIEKIIGFVPSKLNCFLVSKDFRKETINATRKKCILNLNPTNLVSEGLINTQWAFNEIRLATEIFRMQPTGDGRLFVFSLPGTLENCHMHANNVFNRFGLQVEKLSIFNMNIHKEDLLHLLTLLPNLVELDVQKCSPAHVFYDNNIPLNGIIELTRLEKLTIVKSCSFLERISCPAVQDLCLRTIYVYDPLSVQDFYQRHAQIQFIEQKDLPINIQLEHLQLSSLSLGRIPSDQVSTILDNQPNLKLLSLDLYCTVTDQLLQQIATLQQLESLEIFVETHALNSNPLIEGAVNRLKSLKIKTDNVDFITTLLEVKNMQLEELSLERWTVDRLDELGNIGENFPNLKKLSLFRCLISENEFVKLLRLRELKTMELNEVFVDDSAALLQTNISIRELTINFGDYEQVIALLKLMPNIERLNINYSQYLPEFPISRYQEIMNAVLDLKSLKELMSDVCFLKNKEVIKYIMKYQATAKLERIIISETYERYKSEVDSVCAAYKEQFPVITIDHKTNARLTMSRM